MCIRDRYLLVLPVLAYYIIFAYGPMGGLIIAFKNFKPTLGIFDSPWAKDYGFQHFLAFFNSIYFTPVSYTHLDAYKRQSRSCLPSNRSLT